MEPVGDDFWVLDGIPRNLANTRRVLYEHGLRLVDVTPGNRAEIVRSLNDCGYGPFHKFWIDSYDGVRNGASPTDAFVISLGAGPGELAVLAASLYYPYRHLAEPIPVGSPARPGAFV